MAESMRSLAGAGRPAFERNARRGAWRSVLVLAFVLSPTVTGAGTSPAATDSLASFAPPDSTAASPTDLLSPPMVLSAARSIEGDSLRRTLDPRLDEASELRTWKADSSTIRFELGARSEVSNESYYEDAFVDTTFLGRRRVGTPEWRHASVIAGMWNGTRGHQSTQYQLLGEANYGNLVQRGALSARFRVRPGDDWVFFLQPNAEYRHDRTFGRDLEEWRAAAGLGARRTLGDPSTTAELGVRGDFLRTRGLGADFLLDRNSGGASVAVDHLGLTGGEWRFGYRLTGRTFPDSSERDHVEHLSDGRWKWSTPGGNSLSFDGVAARRVTLREVTESRDNYWNVEGGVEARGFTYTTTPLRVRVGGEVFHYDRQDSTLFFDYGVVRAQAACGWERGARWSLSLGPRAEILTAPLNRDESYREIAGILEVEYLAGSGWWSLAPTVGWRNYERLEIAGPVLPPLHSPFAFYELNLIADQPLSSHVRLRAITALRVESHTDPSQDAMSLYASGELRWR